jgi:hypothetical protein
MRASRLVRLCFCAAALAASAGCILYSDDRIIMFAAAVVAALALFIMRETDKSAYGVVEILFALGLLWRAAGEAGAPAASSAEVAEFEWDVILLQIGAATYVLVRGLDNFVGGVRIWRTKSDSEPNGGP